MKIWTRLAFASLMMAGQASAGTYFLAGACGAFDSSHQNQSGLWLCPSFSALEGSAGLSSLTVTGELLIYQSNFQDAQASNVTNVTDWQFSGGTTWAWAVDETSASCFGVVPCASYAGLPTNSQNTAFQNSTTNPFGWLSQIGPQSVQAGFYDLASAGFGAPTVSFDNTYPLGFATLASGSAQVVYAYNGPDAPAAAPEPGGWMLLAAGLAALASRARRPASAR